MAQTLIGASLIDSDGDIEHWSTKEARELQERMRVARERMLADGRRRAHAIDRKSKAVFIAAIAAGLHVRDAAEICDRSVAALYRHRHLDSGFAQEWDDAMEASTAPIEERLESIALLGDPTSMATVRAAEVTLKHRAGRRYQQGGASVKMTQGADGSSLSVRVGTPLPD